MRVPKTPPTWDALSEVFKQHHERLLPDALSVDDSRYFHWDDLRYREPPEGLTREEWWICLTVRRSTARRPLGLVGVTGRPFTVSLTDTILESCHRIDQRGGARVAASHSVTHGRNRERYLVASMMEEAIRSSQLEGAATTRRVAKEMLRTGRPPRDLDECMIRNTYTAMEWIRAQPDRALSPEMVLELHRIVTDETLGDTDHVGALRTSDDVTVTDVDDNIVHTPPPAVELPARLEAMCRFANGEDGGPFLPPVVRAILLHLWLAYDHPFVDGNGRTARGLFYWSMLRSGYWLVEFVSISRLLKEAPTQYALAFLRTETDGNDATYFVHHQIDVLLRAMDSLDAWLDTKVRQTRTLERSLRSLPTLNHRQQALLGHALRTSNAEYTFVSHQNSHNIVYQTARTDILGLVELGLLDEVRAGKQRRFYAVPDLEHRLSDSERR